MEFGNEVKDHEFGLPIISYFLVISLFSCFDREIRLRNEITKKRRGNMSSGVAINLHFVSFGVKSYFL